MPARDEYIRAHCATSDSVVPTLTPGRQEREFEIIDDIYDDRGGFTTQTVSYARAWKRAAFTAQEALRRTQITRAFFFP